MTQTIKSKDGTLIAYEKAGQGKPLILVDGALCSRKFGPSQALVLVLARHFTVFTYDRRGRGESGDTLPYAVDHEVEDLGALLKKAGGSVFVFGVSSGAVLGLLAAAKRLPIKKLALYEAPFIVDNSRPGMEGTWLKIDQAVQAGDRSKAVAKFLKAVGVPAFGVFLMKLFPLWAKLKAVAHTLPYDGAIVKDYQNGKPLSAGRWKTVKIPTLVLDGGKSPQWMRNAMRSLAEVLPKARYQTLEGQAHDAAKAASALEPVLTKFFSEP